MKSYTYRNADIIRDLPKIKLLRTQAKQTQWEIEDLERRTANLRKQLQHQESEIESLASVTEIYEGIAIACRGESWRLAIAVVDQSIERSASAYKAATSGTATEPEHWGAHFYFRESTSGFRKEDWQGLGWSKKDAIYICKRWTALGEKPIADFVKMAKARHRHDPAGTAPKQRRDAFEAAWMAGHHDLAIQLLTERARSTKRPTSTGAQP